MTDTNNERSVAAPMTGAAVFGLGAFGSHKLDSKLTNLGLGRNLTVTDDAIKAISEFANATPKDVTNPDKFIYRYSDLAHKASRARLFKEDPRSIAEWSVEVPELNRWFIDGYRKNILANSEKLSKFLHKRFPSIATKFDNHILNKLSLYNGVLESEFSPLGKWFNDNRIPGIGRTRVLRTHIPSMALSREEALLRVMFEGAAAEGLSNPEISRNISEVTRKLGKRGKFIFDENTGKLLIDPNNPFKLVRGINSVEDMQRIIDRSPILSNIAASRSKLYRGANFKKPFDLLRFAQTMRGKGVKMTLGGLALGSLGIGSHNLIKNVTERNSNTSYLQSVKQWINDLRKNINN